MTIDLSPLYHAIAAVALQCAVGMVFGDWFIGGALGCVWFIAREHTQAEYRWVAQIGNGKRANMPWWGGFDLRSWDAASVLDWLVPVIACAAVYVIAPQSRGFLYHFCHRINLSRSLSSASALCFITAEALSG